MTIGITVSLIVFGIWMIVIGCCLVAAKDEPCDCPYCNDR